MFLEKQPALFNDLELDMGTEIEGLWIDGLILLFDAYQAAEKVGPLDNFASLRCSLGGSRLATVVRKG
jgi:hypothetical protein